MRVIMRAIERSSERWLGFLPHLNDFQNKKTKKATSESFWSAIVQIQGIIITQKMRSHCKFRNIDRIGCVLINIETEWDQLSESCVLCTLYKSD